MLMSSVCIHKVTTCFTSASLAIRWPVRCSIRVPKRCKSLGPILPTGLVTRYGAAAGMSWTTLPIVRISFPVVYICLDLLRDTCMTSDSPRTPTWSKPSPPVCMRLTSISSIAGCKHWWQDGTNSYMSVVITWESWRVPSTVNVPCRPVHRSQNKFSASEPLLQYFFKLLCMCVYCHSLFYSLFVSSSGTELRSGQSHFSFWSTSKVDKHWNSLGGMPVHLKVIIATGWQTNTHTQNDRLYGEMSSNVRSYIFVLYLLSAHSIPFIPLLTIYILLFIYHSSLNTFYFCTTLS